MKPSKAVVTTIFVLATFVRLLDITIVTVALPAIGADLDEPGSATAAVVVSYLVGMCLLMPAAGRLGDRFGDRAVFLPAIAVFTVASVLCGTADSLVELVVMRFFQGLGGGLSGPVGLAMLMRAYPGEQRATAVRISTLPIALAPMLGAAAGGVLITVLSWQWVFYVNAPVGVVVFLLGLLALGPSERRDTGRFDGAGLVLSAVGFTGVMLSLTRGASGGWGEPVVWIAGVVGVGALAALVRVELTAGSPLIDVRLLGRGTFRTMSLAILLLTAGYLGVQYTFPLLYQTALGHTAFVTGLLTLPLPVGIVVGAQVAPALGRRLGLRRALVTAYLTFAAGSLVLGLNGVGSVEAVIVAEMFCLGVAQAVGFNLAQAAMFQDVSGERTGSASSVFNVTLQVGGALGVALLSGVLAVAGPVREDGLPDVAAHQASAMAVAVWAVAAAAVVAFSRGTGTAAPAPAEERGTASA